LENYSNGNYVPVGAKTKSLAGLMVHRSQLRFVEDHYDPKKPKLRAEICDVSHAYRLPVSGTRLHLGWLENGLPALNRMLPDGYLHLRVGLARPWKQRLNECTVMLNGVLW
jgi:hypothetical protein